MKTFRGLRFGWLGLFLLLFSRFTLAAAPQTMTVTCGGEKNQKQKQTGLIRAKFDNGTWTYNLVAGGDLQLKDVVWSYPGKDIINSGWGKPDEKVIQPGKNYQMAWTSPLTTDLVAAKTGNFKVMVTGKRVCPGGVPGVNGGEAEEDTFEITWDADVIGVKILSGTTDITQPKGDLQSVKVGQVNKLTTQLDGLPQNAVVASTWAVPGVFYEKWKEDGNPPSSPALNTDAINFYWVDGGLARTVSYAITVNGEALPAATAKFDVDRPSYTFTVAPTGTIAVGPGTGYPGGAGEKYVHYGVPDTPTAGITFSTNPPRPADNVEHPVIRLAQLATALDRKVQVGGKWYKWSPTKGLDKYPGGIADSPGQGIRGTTDFRATEEFKTWLLYKPPGIADAQWVPLKIVSWSWSVKATTVKANAQDKEGVWVNSAVVGEGSLVSATPAIEAVGTQIDEYPLWPQKIDDGDYFEVPAPPD